MTSVQSVSEWFASLQAGQVEALEKLWERYIRQLVTAARRRLEDIPKRVADEDDLAQSVFLSLYRGALAGRFADIRNRDELWWLLLAMTRQKVVDHVRRETAQKRGGGLVQDEFAFKSANVRSRVYSLAEIVSDDPTPEMLAIMEEQSHHLLGLLKQESLRKVAVSRIEGYTVAEIAAAMGLSTRSVERKLKMVRDAWTLELVAGERDA